MSTIPKYILNRNGGGGGGGGSLNPEDLKTVGYESLVKDPLMPVGNVEFGYQQAEAGYPGGYLRVGQQRVAMRTVNGEPLIGNTDIVITPGEANMVPITYANLKALRDNEQLVPGTWYRITDYECTTIANGTISAQHQFDIVVLAIDSGALDENAFACRNAEDLYFSGEHLDAWRLKYCIDNDKSRFGWAQEESSYIVTGGETYYLSYKGNYWEYRRFDPVMGDLFSFTSPNPSVGDFAFENSDLTGRSNEITDVGVGGKGVIYWMRDEWGNEAPYDFKNIRFARWAVSDITGELTPKSLDSLKDIFVYDFKSNPFFFGLKDTNYTQGGLTFIIDDKTEPANYYTFGGDTDRSLNGGANGCYGNVIKPWIDNLGVQQLNNGVWVKTDDGKEQSHHSTTCGYNCHDFTCGNGCYDFTCGNGCYGWTCGNECFDWTCGNECFGWTCGDGCFGWTCGNECIGWTCGDGCFGWTCGNVCYGWTCGNNCYGWTCGNDCYDFTCGNDCRLFHLLSGTNGDLTNLITSNASYSQYVGFDSQVQLISRCVLD